MLQRLLLHGRNWPEFVIVGPANIALNLNFSPVGLHLRVKFVNLVKVRLILFLWRMCWQLLEVGLLRWWFKTFGPSQVDWHVLCRNYVDTIENRTVSIVPPWNVLQCGVYVAAVDWTQLLLIIFSTGHNFYVLYFFLILVSACAVYAATCHSCGVFEFGFVNALSLDLEQLG